MSNLTYYLRYNQIQDESWWAFRVVAWYCKNRRIRLPEGRCHFGEILLLYAPMYILLGILFKTLMGIGIGVKFTTWPLWTVLMWFGLRVEEDTRTYKKRLLWVGVLSVVALLGAEVAMMVYSQPTDVSDWLWLVSSMQGTLVVTFIGAYLTLWVVYALAPKLQPVVALGREASFVLNRPTFRQVVQVASATVKAVPTATRRSWDVGAIAASLAQDLWRRRICPRLSYGFDRRRYDS